MNHTSTRTPHCNHPHPYVMTSWTTQALGHHTVITHTHTSWTTQALGHHTRCNHTHTSWCHEPHKYWDITLAASTHIHDVILSFYLQESPFWITLNATCTQTLCSETHKGTSINTDTGKGQDATCQLRVQSVSLYHYCINSSCNMNQLLFSFTAPMHPNPPLQHNTHTSTRVRCVRNNTCGTWTRNAS